MASSEKRRAPRISSRIRVEFIERKKTVGETVNLSRYGIFLVTDVDRPANSLVRLKLFLPPDQKSIEIFGQVVRQGAVEGKTGLGINFLELASDDRDRWLAFVMQVEQLSGVKPKSRDDNKPGEDRRKSPRTSASFMVRFKTTKRLEEFVSHNVSTGGMFLSTPVLKQEGQKVNVVIIHPVSGKDHELLAEVIRVNQEATESEGKGMALRFVDLTDDEKKSLESFVQS